MSFSFGFGGDDIDNDGEPWRAEDDNHMKVDGQGGEVPSEQMKPHMLDLEDLLSSLPSSLSFRWHQIPSEYGEGAYQRQNYPRRELHDIRAQIMSTADPTNVDQVLEAGLSSSGDLASGIYEGGFKTWECSNDLAWWLLERGPASSQPGLGVCDTFELGAGTAFPSSVLLAERLKARARDGTNHPAQSNIMLLADYNEAVLRMCTFPNIFLTWYCTSRELLEAESQAIKDEGESQDEGYVEITADLGLAFLDDLQKSGVELAFVAGSWGGDFVDIIEAITRERSSTLDASHQRCILASETIYSPQTVDIFTQTMTGLLQGTRAPSQAIIAAKRIYFGVGGGVDEFKRRLPSTARLESEWEGGQGVGRWIGQIRLNSEAD